jgi:hypothetical protein
MLFGTLAFVCAVLLLALNYPNDSSASRPKKIMSYILSILSLEFLAVPVLQLANLI